MTIKDIKKKFGKGVDAIDFDILLSFVLKKDKVFLYSHPEYKIDILAIEKLKRLIKRRLRNEPIAYLVGHKEFYGLDFKVNNKVLVPRPETEMMVEEALSIAHISPLVTLVDVGTGTGCIVISIAKQLVKLQITNQKSQFFGLDISGNALKVARLNAKACGLGKTINFIKGDLLQPLINSKFKIQNSKLIICANLPYLTPAQIINSPSIQKEPILALEAGSDGLKYYKKLFKQIKAINFPPTERGADEGRVSAKKRGRNALLIEIDPSQEKSIQDLINKELPFVKYKIKNDLKVNQRLVVIDL